MTERYVGLMSGTSLDGVDGVILELTASDRRVTHVSHLAMPTDLRQEFLALNARHGSDELHRSSLAANRLMQLYAQAVTQLLHSADIPASAIRAIGAHGQTVRHLPGPAGSHVQLHEPWVPYTIQLGNPALLVELTGIPVVAEFRHRDVAASGQGAPLVPAFHQAVFAKPQCDVAVVNVGGMANVTWLDADGSVSGFDTGPGNVLLDGWCERHTGHTFDDSGAWSRQGKVCDELLASLLSEPFFQLTGARSTGRELFNMEWLVRHVNASAAMPDPADVQATLVELTARSIVQSLPRRAMNGQLVVCGGGAMNLALLSSLEKLLPGTSVMTSEVLGIPVMAVEAAAFAWLASQTVHGVASNVPKATGARGPRVLGAIYPA